MRWKIILLFLVIIGLQSASSSDFETSSLSIKSAVRQGESVDFPITVLNTGSSEIFSISYSPKNHFINLDKSEFFLDSYDEGSLIARLDSSPLIPGVYTGNIVITSGNNSIVIPVVFEVESNKLTFDALVDIAPKFSIVSPGDNFESNIRIINLNSAPKNVTIIYFIKNLDDTVILEERQTIFVQSKAEVTKSFQIPEELEDGEYFFSVIVYDEDNDYSGTSSAQFSISSEEAKGNISSALVFSSFSVILLLIVSFVIINYYWSRRVLMDSRKWRKKIGDIKHIKLSEISKRISKLEYQKVLLRRALAKGYIKKSSFEDDSREINKVIRRLKKRL